MADMETLEKYPSNEGLKYNIFSEDGVREVIQKYPVHSLGEPIPDGKRIFTPFLLCKTAAEIYGKSKVRSSIYLGALHGFSNEVCYLIDF